MNVGPMKKQRIAFCDSTKQDRQLQFNPIKKKMSMNLFRVLNVSKTGVKSLKTLIALAIVREKPDQV